MRFSATIELGGKTATGVVVPPEVVAQLSAGKRPPVLATINGYTYRSSVASMGGRFLLGISADVRAKAGVAAGDEVDTRHGDRGSALPVHGLGTKFLTQEGQRGLFGVQRLR